MIVYTIIPLIKTHCNHSIMSSMLLNEQGGASGLHYHAYQFKTAFWYTPDVAYSPYSSRQAFHGAVEHIAYLNSPQKIPFKVHSVCYNLKSVSLSETVPFRRFVRFASICPQCVCRTSVEQARSSHVWWLMSRALSVWPTKPLSINVSAHTFN